MAERYLLIIGFVPSLTSLFPCTVDNTFGLSFDHSSLCVKAVWMVEWRRLLACACFSKSATRRGVPGDQFTDTVRWSDSMFTRALEATSACHHRCRCISLCTRRCPQTPHHVLTRTALSRTHIPDNRFLTVSQWIGGEGYSRRGRHYNSSSSCDHISLNLVNRPLYAIIAGVKTVYRLMIWR